VRVVKVLAPLGKLSIFIFLFCFFCLREKEATLRQPESYAIPPGRPPFMGVSRGCSSIQEVLLRSPSAPRIFKLNIKIWK